jgi:drug/metabolite transporter (DMT)-like permease
MDKFVFLVAVTAVLIVGLVMFSNALRRRQQNQMHNRLLDKFTSAQDLGVFLQSAVGREYVANLTDSVGNPLMSMVAAVRNGVVLCVMGAGFFVPSVRAWDSPVPVTAIGTLLVFLGIGFMASGAASFALSKALHLLPPSNDQQQ